MRKRTKMLGALLALTFVLATCAPAPGAPEDPAPPPGAPLLTAVGTVGLTTAEVEELYRAPEKAELLDTTLTSGRLEEIDQAGEESVFSLFRDCYPCAFPADRPA